MIRRGVVIGLWTRIWWRTIVPIARVWIPGSIVRVRVRVIVRCPPPRRIYVRIRINRPIRPTKADTESKSPAPASPAPPAIPAAVTMKSAVPTSVDSTMKATLDGSDTRSEVGPAPVKTPAVQASTSAKPGSANMATALSKSGLRPPEDEKRDDYQWKDSEGFIHSGLSSLLSRSFRFCQLLKPYSRAIRY